MKDCWISTAFHWGPPGIDLACDWGTPITAAKAGKVTYAGWDITGYGWRVDVYDGIDLERYAHLERIDVWLGQELAKGQQVGTVGSSGWSTGPHLHFEIWYQNLPVDPLLPLPR